MKVVLDTNVIIAAFAARGLCSEIFESCVLNHRIITSEFVLLEVKRNLGKKIHLPVNIIKELIQYLRNSSEIVVPEPVSESLCRDKDDNKIIGTAISGQARFIITGDQDLLTLKNYQEIKIISPREFWNFLKEQLK